VAPLQKNNIDLAPDTPTKLITATQNTSYKQNLAMKYPKVIIIILNWNGWVDTIECLESVYRTRYPNYEVILVDNNSQDESISKIKEFAEGKIKPESAYFRYDPSNKPLTVQEYSNNEIDALDRTPQNHFHLGKTSRLLIIRNEENYGFAKGNNIAILHALKALEPGYVLLLNNDTVIQEDALGRLVEAAELSDRIGIAGPEIRPYDDPSTVAQLGGRMNFISGLPMPYTLRDIDQAKYQSPFEVGFLSGTALLIRRDVFLKIGLLDPNLFIIAEETDFEMRAQQAGYKLLCVPQSKVFHKLSVSLKKTPYTTIYYAGRNRVIFLRRYSSKTNLILFLLHLFLKEHPHFIVERMRKRTSTPCGGKAISKMVTGILDGFRFEPQDLSYLPANLDLK
jgi:GT2 family glycosyltransferase